MFGKTLVLAFHISYSYAEWYLPFSRGEVLTVTEISAYQIVPVLGIIAILYGDKLFVIVYRDKTFPSRYRFIGIGILLFQNQR